MTLRTKKKSKILTLTKHFARLIREINSEWRLEPNGPWHGDHCVVTSTDKSARVVSRPRHKASFEIGARVVARTTRADRGGRELVS